MGVGVVADTEERSRVIESVLEFAGLTIRHPQEAAVVVVQGRGGDVNPSQPVIYVGETPPDALRVMAQINHLRYHSLIGALHEVQTALRDDSADTSALPCVPVLIGGSASMVTLRAMAQRAASGDAPVLLAGERGTGKEMLARLIHDESARSAMPFVPLDCSAVPEELVESELFGHERGAFPGALTNKAGRLQLAQGGTLFLDNVDALTYPLQVKFLRALEARCFQPLGGSQSMALDVRVMCATSQNLEEAVREGAFREDLFYQLSVFPLQLVPLRERPEDIPAAMERIAAEIEQKQNISLRLSVDVMDTLCRYAWPGNVRELKNLLERLSLQFGADVVTTRDLPPKLTGAPVTQGAQETSVELEATPDSVRLPVNGLDLKDFLARLERSLIEQALDDTGAVVARAADKLHIRRTTLVEKMRKYGISRA